MDWAHGERNVLRVNPKGFRGGKHLALGHAKKALAFLCITEYNPCYVTHVISAARLRKRGGSEGARLV